MGAVLGAARFLHGGQAEIHQLRFSLARDEDVGELDIPVCQAARVGVGQAGRRLFRDLQRLGRLQLLADRQEVAEVAALDKLHDDEVLPGGRVATDFEDLDNVRMAQRQADPPFALEEIDGVVVLAPALAEHLDGDHTPGLRIVRPEEPAEAARSDFVEEAVPSQKVPLLVSLEEFLSLVGCQVALAFHPPEERFGGRAWADRFPAFFKLLIGHQPQSACQLGELRRVEVCHTGPR